MKLQLALALVLCAFLYVFGFVYAENFDLELASLVDRVSKLYSMGVNTTSVVEKLSSAVKAYDSGDFEKAWSLLSEARNMVAELEKGASETYFWLLLLKACIVALLASIPIAVYLLLPRIYLYLWFRAKRKWVVRR